MRFETRKQSKNLNYYTMSLCLVRKSNLGESALCRCNDTMLLPLFARQNIVL